MTPELTTPDPTVTPLPDRLESSRAKLVYLALATRDGASATRLQALLGMPAISLFPVLETLADKNLVVRDGNIYRPVAPR